MSHSMANNEKRAFEVFSPSRRGFNEVYRKSNDWLENRKFAVVSCHVNRSRSIKKKFSFVFDDCRHYGCSQPNNQINP
ncbi:Uncharacterized protein APZ42_032911 [Daphnia magna]|uniref:Uncharacterized protein n=1 Tax=Daphnia magna TaxID=35525 RepID=A0A0P5DHP6_9CRUS|nr:Uncharacterized protein APZ42_032911 [Daphnia magna]